MRSARSFIVAMILLVFLAGCGQPKKPAEHPPIFLPTPTSVVMPTIAWTPTTPTPPSVDIHPSPTPTPTWTPTRTLLPYGWVRPLKARLRAAPSTEADTIALIHGGTTLRLLGRLADGTWYRVRVIYPDRPAQEGWMAASVIVTFASPEEVPVVTGSK